MNQTGLQTRLGTGGLTKHCSLSKLVASSSFLKRALTTATRLMQKREMETQQQPDPLPKLDFVNYQHPGLPTTEFYDENITEHEDLLRYLESALTTPDLSPESVPVPPTGDLAIDPVLLRLQNPTKTGFLARSGKRDLTYSQRRRHLLLSDPRWTPYNADEKDELKRLEAKAKAHPTHELLRDLFAKRRQAEYLDAMYKSRREERLLVVLKTELAQAQELAGKGAGAFLEVDVDNNMINQKEKTLRKDAERRQRLVDESLRRQEGLRAKMYQTVAMEDDFRWILFQRKCRDLDKKPVIRITKEGGRLELGVFKDCFVRDPRHISRRQKQDMRRNPSRSPNGLRDDGYWHAESDSTTMNLDTPANTIMADAEPSREMNLGLGGMNERQGLKRCRCTTNLADMPNPDEFTAAAPKRRNGNYSHIFSKR
ncbi:hypothetical protein JHW43_001265 [Diplocarpon mali]|nr:hypothetical protein JHW43_001265 [Diplocarpon mali]